MDTCFQCSNCEKRGGGGGPGSEKLAREARIRALKAQSNSQLGDLGERRNHPQREILEHLTSNEACFKHYKIILL